MEYRRQIELLVKRSQRLDHIREMLVDLVDKTLETEIREIEKDIMILRAREDEELQNMAKNLEQRPLREVI